MKVFARVIGLCAAFYIIGCVVGLGCSQKLPPGAATAAESAYTTALLRCVDQAKTLADSRACRQRVDASWGITEKEAGK